MFVICSSSRDSIGIGRPSEEICEVGSADAAAQKSVVIGPSSFGEYWVADTDIDEREFVH